MAYFHAKVAFVRFAVVVHADSAWILPLARGKSTAPFYLLKILVLTGDVALAHTLLAVYRFATVKKAISSQSIKRKNSRDKFEEIKCFLEQWELHSTLVELSLIK